MNSYFGKLLKNEQSSTETSFTLVWSMHSITDKILICMKAIDIDCDEHISH